MTLIYAPIAYGDTIDEEVLVLFKPNIITMPEGKIRDSPCGCPNRNFFRPVKTGRFNLFFVVARFIGHK